MDPIAAINQFAILGIPQFQIRVHRETNLSGLKCRVALEMKQEFLAGDRLIAENHTDDDGILVPVVTV